MKRFFLALAATVVLSGCASGYTQFYKNADGATPEVVAKRRAAPPPARPAVEHVGKMDAEVIQAYLRRNYLAVGVSSFSSGRDEPDENAVRQGISVGADLVVIVHPKYLGSQTSAVPLTLPTTSTTTVRGSFGAATATTYGTSTTVIPVTVHRSEYGAAYLVKTKPPAFGAFFRELSDAERQELQSNKGVVIRTVIDDTPAFNADILVGDIVTHVNGVQLESVQKFLAMSRSLSNTATTFTIVRKGQRIEKVVQIGEVRD